MSEKNKGGRPPTVSIKTMRRKGVHISQELEKKAIEIGKGNFSDGVRFALFKYTKEAKNESN